MSRRRPVVVLSTLILVAAATVDARAQNDGGCAVVLQARLDQDKKDNKPVAEIANPTCFDLAGYIYTHLTEEEFAEIAAPRSTPVADIFSQRDVQARSTQQPDLSGTAAQGHAIPGVQPAGVASGTIAALGTRSGQDAIAAISVNPATLFLSDVASEALARLSRVADVTVFVPVTSGNATESEAPGKLRYIGARVRLNFTGASAGSAVWKKADELLRNRISDAAKNGVGALEALLLSTSNVRACADALLGEHDAEAVARDCGAPFGFTPDMAAARQLRDELARIRREADSKYFGADIRADFGDPTLGTEENARGTFLFAGLAVGRNFAGTNNSGVGFRGRLGLRHAKLDSEATAEFAAEGGAGFEVVRYVGEDQLSISGGVEFRYGNAPADTTDQFQTNFTLLRASLSLPIASGNSVSLNIAGPIAGNVTPTFSVSYNWGLLLSDKPGGR